jgi:two-component system cell cycle response regulator
MPPVRSICLQSQADCKSVVVASIRGATVTLSVSLGSSFDKPTATQVIVKEEASLINGTLGPPHQIKMLIADDSAVSRKLVEYALSDRRYVLIFATNGQEAVQRVEEHNPELVVVDWLMPDLTGPEICQHIRARPDAPYAYIIVLTAKSEKHSLVAGLGAGADDYLTKPFDADELVARVGVGLRTIQLHREVAAKNVLLQELALTDALTGLPNRRAIEDWASRQLSSAVRHRFSFHVVMADLDHFKSVNDTYGHDAGDVVLKRFAEIVRSNCRSSDICGRMGGEEFLLSFTHVSDENAVRLAERVRAQFEAAEFRFRRHTVAFTASFGLAGLKEMKYTDFKSLLSQADAALYSAKRLGRNRVGIAAAMGMPDVTQGTA